jgi:hypothetical protein
VGAVTRRAPLTAALAVLAAGCGGGGGDDKPRAARTATPSPSASPSPSPSPEATASPGGGAAKGGKAIVDGWARTLARSDEAGAARYFALPLVVSQGPRQRLTSRAARGCSPPPAAAAT